MAPIHSAIVILGAGYAGLGIAHKLLKYTRAKVPNLKVILVSPSTHHFWNMASVRGIVAGEFSDDDLFSEITPGFEKYPDGSFEFVLGTASRIDVAEKIVHVTTAHGLEQLSFTHLVVATGSSYPGRLPFVNLGSHEETATALHDLQQKALHAKSIIIAGSGATGVETAAELGHAYGRTKQITLIIPGEQPLSGVMSQVRKAAAHGLEQLGVSLIRNARVASSTQAEDGALVTLTNGSVLKADLYLPFFGMRPNTGFIPPRYLDSAGNIVLDRTLRIAGTNVWGVGDVGNLQPKQAIYAESQAHQLAKNLHAVLTGDFKGIQDMQLGRSTQIFVTLGKKNGTGQWFGVMIPSFVVTMSKGRSFFSEKGAGLVAGKNIVRSTI